VTRDELVEGNLKLVHSCANRFRNRGIEYEELYSAGCLGLLKAANRFDESMGNAFSTYAVPVILGEIKRLFRDGGTVKVSRSLKEKAAKLIKLNDEIKNRTGKEPTVSVLAEESGLEPAQIAELLNIALPVISLTSQTDEREKQFDIPVDGGEDKITDRLALSQVMKTLKKDDRELITLRYFNCLTQTQTAKILGISQVQVSRKEKKILLEMRQKLLK